MDSKEKPVSYPMNQAIRGPVIDLIATLLLAGALLRGENDIASSSRFIAPQELERGRWD